MTLEEAIKRYTSNAEYERSHGSLQGCLEFRQLAEWLKDYKRLLEQEPNTDAVSRQAVHDMLENLPITVEDKWFNWLQKACMRLAELPPVTPTRPKGHFIYKPRPRLINETDEGCEYIADYWCKCSECGGDFGYVKMRDAYCKFCGADMREGEA